MDGWVGTVGIRPNRRLAATLTLFKNRRPRATRNRFASLSDIYIHVRVRTQVASFNRDCDLLYYLEIFKNLSPKGQLILKCLFGVFTSKKQKQVNR